MTRWPAQLMVLAVVTVAAGVAIYFLREKYESRHVPNDPESRVEVVIDTDQRGGADDQPLEAMTESLVTICYLDVDALLVPDSLEARGDGQFRFVLQPSLDDSDREQLDGCLEDWTVENLRAHVLEFNELEPVRAA